MPGKHVKNQAAEKLPLTEQSTTYDKHYDNTTI